jgi:hypothetical protein
VTTHRIETAVCKILGKFRWSRIIRPRFEQEDFVLRRLRHPARDHSTGSPGTDHHRVCGEAQ